MLPHAAGLDPGLIRANQYFNSEQRYTDDARAQRAERMAAELEAQLAARELVAQRTGAE